MRTYKINNHPFVITTYIKVRNAKMQKMRTIRKNIMKTEYKFQIRLHFCCHENLKLQSQNSLSVAKRNFRSKSSDSQNCQNFGHSEYHSRVINLCKCLAKATTNLQIGIDRRRTIDTIGFAAACFVLHKKTRTNNFATARAIQKRA